MKVYPGIYLSEFTQISKLLCLKLLLDISERIPKHMEGEVLGISVHNIRMGFRATAANHNLVLETGMSEMQILLFVF